MGDPFLQSRGCGLHSMQHSSFMTRKCGLQAQNMATYFRFFYKT